MDNGKPFYKYLPDGTSFVSPQAASIRTLYFPLCGIDEAHIKSSITPFLSGDIKIDKSRFVTKPVSREDLRFDSRNFFIFCAEDKLYSLARPTPASESVVEMGQLWHSRKQIHKDAGITLEALNFVPVDGSDVELMKVTVHNTGKQKLKFTPTFNVPLFGRALANKHDHEHVTALLHRTHQLDEGVLIEPSMSFDERGHMQNDCAYFVFGTDSKGQKPVGTFPTVDSFYGEQGNVIYPEAVIRNLKPQKLSEEQLNGKEVCGALRFKDCALASKESISYLFLIGAATSAAEATAVYQKFQREEDFAKALGDNEKYWAEKTRAIEFKTGDAEFNAWTKWVTLQPILRRIYGCSFLPDHDYGKGGKGWRDIWQDLLSLILIEPAGIKQALINNFAGVRIDGSNATIIGDKPGQFLADRNAITRVWMDHGVWPYLTTKLYVDQTGDVDILFHENTYFRDLQLSRTFEKDLKWTPSDGNRLKDKNSNIYSGSILEHILVQHLVQFFNVGGHNCIRLESADWNDGLDMAFARGESVAFMSLYGGNMLDLADLLESVAADKNIKEMTLAKEILALMDTTAAMPVNYDEVAEKRKMLFEVYFPSVQPEISGEKFRIPVADIVKDLRRKGKWIFKHIKAQEKIAVNGNNWFNGYYDNKGERVEGRHNENVRMTLTGQVFPIMSGLADNEDIKQIIESVRKYLKDKKLSGYRLNSDFGVHHYLDLGRAFGFTYGTKENGAFFSHMAVMYAYALYKRGFAHEGHEVLRSIYAMSVDTSKSKIYPGIPEYFDSLGQGMYHYLTGSASWYILTFLTQVFGVRGNAGELTLEPKLVKEQFGKAKTVSVNFQFAGKNITVEYVNDMLLDYGKYALKEVYLNGKLLVVENIQADSLSLPKAIVENVPENAFIKVVLG